VALENEINKAWKKPFYVIWMGQNISMLGTALVQFAIIWWLTKTSGSPLVLSLATLFAFLPEVALGPFVGTLVDRWNRRVVMICADSFVALASLGAIILIIQGQFQVWHAFAILFIRNLGSAFHWPAMQASTSLMVPEDQLSRIAGLTQSAHGTLAIVSPPLGALLLNWMSLEAVVAVDIVTAIIAIFSLAFIAVPQPPKLTSSPMETPRFWDEVKTGVHYVWNWKGLRTILIIGMAMNLFFMPVLGLLPIYVTEHLQGDAFVYGWMESAWGIGVVVGGLILGVWGGFKKKIHTGLTALFGIGLAMLFIGAAPTAAVVMVLIGWFFDGIMGPMYNGSIYALLQSRVAPDVQGRVFMLMSSSSGLMTLIAMLVAGPLAEVIGVRSWYFIAGAGILITALWAASVKDLRQFETVGGREQITEPLTS
jgi:DHA3 family macrolide efflux protein-like MFS transporter